MSAVSAARALAAKKQVCTSRSLTSILKNPHRNNISTQGAEQVEIRLKEASICRSLAQEGGDFIYYEAAWNAVQQAYAASLDSTPNYQYGLYASMMEWGIINAERGILSKAFLCYREARQIALQYGNDVEALHWSVAAVEKIAESIAMFADSGRSLHLLRMKRLMGL